MLLIRVSPFLVERPVSIRMGFIQATGVQSITIQKRTCASHISRGHTLPFPVQSVLKFLTPTSHTHTVAITHFHPFLLRSCLGSKKDFACGKLEDTQMLSTEFPWACGPLQFWAHCSDLFPSPYLRQNAKQEYTAHVYYL